MKKQLVFVVSFVFIVLTLIGCASPTPTPTPTPVPPTATPIPPTATPIPPTATAVPPTATATLVPPTATPTKPPTATPIPPLPPAPKSIKFKTADGAELDGLYYPAAVNPAPIIVLMHWAGGLQDDWYEIAYWLQNRGQGGKTSNPKNVPWLNATWFPSMLKAPVLSGAKEQSFAVFTFNYRKAFRPNELREDSFAAMKTASELEGVDSKQVLSAGASIGADGAAHGCAWLNAQKGKGLCLGAMPLSPGNYLGAPYPAAVAPLQSEQPPKPVWCFAAEGDRESAPTCNSAQGAVYRQLIYAGNKHGMTLIDPNVKPKNVDANTLQLMLDWIKTSLGL